MDKLTSANLNLAKAAFCASNRLLSIVDQMSTHRMLDDNHNARSGYYSGTAEDHSDDDTVRLLVGPRKTTAMTTQSGY